MMRPIDLDEDEAQVAYVRKWYAEHREQIERKEKRKASRKEKLRRLAAFLRIRKRR